mmetsp:Transcript_35802/g.91135  ORF Transcript_35802/g.91135 Transcript_35802/m.91135 type:complete len:186 (-) Transcript_35802:207-764(-)
MAVARFVAATMLLFAEQTAGAGYHMGKLCRGHACTDTNFPILDYMPNERKCVCRAHPCWEDSGKVHYCNSPKHPFLHFHYKVDRSLICGCSEHPHYNTRYISHDLCPGHACDSPDHPVLDYDQVQDACICRAHPCHDIDGVKHLCPEGKVLRYREDEPEIPRGKAKGQCECIPKMDPPSMNKGDL